MPNRGAILIPTREGEQGRFNFKCNQGATYGMTQLLYSDAIVGFLTEFAKTTDHRPEILLSFGFVPKVETRVGLINWLIQDPGNAAVADEQAFVRRLAETEPAQKRKLMIDLYKRVIDGVADLGFPLSIHLEAAYGAPRRPSRRSPRCSTTGRPTKASVRVSEPSSRASCETRLDGLTIRDAARLGRRLKNLRGNVSPEKLQQIAEQFTAAEALVATREAAVPTITYPDLPVSDRRDEIAKAIAEHQVVVVAGETGSGKTTQLPKICLELGRGIRGTIGHTQPRRLAARTVAQRIADELGTPLGDAVGYTVRFTDQASDRTLVKLMTDGILLAEIQRDRRLLRYDTLILDEAHERSLNVDFLLGLSARAAAPQARPQGDRHVGDHRARAVRRSLRRSRTWAPAVGRRSSRCPGGPIRSKSGTGHWKSPRRRHQVMTIPTTPTTRSSAPRCVTRPRRSSTPSVSWRRSRRATCWCSCPGSAKSATPQKHCAVLSTCTPRCCRSTPGCQQPSSREVFAAAHRPPSRARHQRRRDVADRAGHPLRRRPRHRTDLAVQPPDQGAAAADRADLAGVGRAAGGPLGPHRARRVHPPLLRGRTSSRGRASPTPRSCGPTSPR